MLGIMLGIDFVLFYAPLLFAQAGLDANTSSIIASGVTGMVLFITTILGTFYVDKVGRRTGILAGGVCIAICHLSIGSLCELFILPRFLEIASTHPLHIDASGAAYTPAGKWAVIVLIELFAISFSGSWAIYVRLYTAEIQPSRTRAAANSFGIGANQLCNTIVALTSPVFLAKSAFGE